MTRDEAIAQLSDAGHLVAEALAVLEQTDDLSFEHGLISRIVWKVERHLGLVGGTIVKNADGTSKPPPPP